MRDWRLSGKHPGLHSRGFAGQGICPQDRTTPQAPEGIYHQKNPLKPTPGNLSAGESLFQIDAQPTACKICHGASGNGLGMMAPGMKPPPRNFVCAAMMKTIPDGQMFWVIRNGSPGTGMPAYKDLNEEQIWRIVLYLRQFSE
ncbi:MAG: c-type cytochrome [Nitrospinaceae bacterium]